MTLTREQIEGMKRLASVGDTFQTVTREGLIGLCDMALRSFSLADELEAMGKDGVIVPKAATDAMIIAGVKSLHGEAVYKNVMQEGLASMEDDVSMMYSTMLAAVSEAPAREGDG